MESIELIINDEAITNDRGYKLLNRGLDKSRFELNPILLYQHDAEKIIGRCDSLRVEGSKLIGVFVFDEKDALAKDIMRKVKENFLRGVSPGILIKHMLFYPNKDDEADQWELFEVSIVTIPSNAHSVKLYSKEGKAIEKHEEDSYIENLKFKPNQNHYNPMKDTEQKVNLITLSTQTMQILGLSNAVNVEEVGSLIDRLALENKELKEEKEGHRIAERDALIQDALQSGKIKEKQKEHFSALFDKDEDLCKELLAGMTAPKSITEQLQAQTKTQMQGNREKFSASWEELDKQDKLLQLKAQDFDLFKEKYKERFGVDYKA